MTTAEIIMIFLALFILHPMGSVMKFVDDKLAQCWLLE